MQQIATLFVAFATLSVALNRKISRSSLQEMLQVDDFNGE
jgi:hypothetical protein